MSPKQQGQRGRMQVQRWILFTVFVVQLKELQFLVWLRNHTK